MIAMPHIVAVGIYNMKVFARGRTLTPLRRVSVFELELPLEAGGTSYIDAESRPISESYVIAAKPGQTRHTRLPYRCAFVHVIVREGTLFDMLSRLPDYIEIGKDARIPEIFHALAGEYDIGSEADTVAITGLVLELVYRLSRIAGAIKAEHALGSMPYSAAERAIDYIGENLTARLTLESVAAEVSFSPVYFHSVFKSATGMTLRDYVELQRIKKATALLSVGEKTLTEIAYECGFSSQSYFSYAFKRRMKMTPRQYMKKVAEDYEKQVEKPTEAPTEEIGEENDYFFDTIGENLKK